jgi:hypothetical protein
MYCFIVLETERVFLLSKCQIVNLLLNKSRLIEEMPQFCCQQMKLPESL